MAFNGITLSALISEIREKTLGGRVAKIQQTEADEILLTIRNQKNVSRIVISANASLPLIYLTEENRTSPPEAPAFCMLLRKQIGNGKLVAVSQPGFERIVDFSFEHLNEMGDIRIRHLKFEVMGRYSNIILTGDDGVILDAIKRIPADISSVRLVLPGQPYRMPPSQGKNPPDWYMERGRFTEGILQRTGALGKAFPSAVTGFSRSTGEELAARAGLDSARSMDSLTAEEQKELYRVYSDLVREIRQEHFTPAEFFEEGVPVDYAAFPSVRYDKKSERTFGSMSELIRTFYREKEERNRIRQKTADLRRILDHALEKTARKADLQRKQLDSTADREQCRIYGELLNIYGYGLKGKEKELVCLNYYDGKEVHIPLDETLTAAENSQKYFARYQKKKRTAEAVEKLLQETEEELTYLYSARHALSLVKTEQDVRELTRELDEAGELKKSEIAERKRSGSGKKPRKKKQEELSRPLHFLSREGYDLYVGKNNLQNDLLTFQMASGGDMWFHAKKIPGSHVIAKRRGTEEFPDSVYEDAARLAAHFSAGDGQGKKEVDYTERKNLKKPPHAKPGYVIYHRNYSMMASTDISDLKIC